MHTLMFRLMMKRGDTFDFDDGTWSLNNNILNTKQKKTAWIRTIQEHKYRLGSRIGEESASGVVHSFEPMHLKSKDDDLNLYVLKRVVIDEENKTLINRTLLEAIFGETFVNAPIPVVYAHRYDKVANAYEILMQNVIRTTKERSTSKSIPLLQFVYRQYPMTFYNLKIIHDAIVDFYKITKHFHGDLHLNNIMVTFNRKHPEKLTRVTVIDFGSTMPFMKTDWRRIDTLKRLYEFDDVITKAYHKILDHPNFNSQELTNTWGELLYMKHGGAIIHNLRQKQDSMNFWREIINFSQFSYAP